MGRNKLLFKSLTNNQIMYIWGYDSEKYSLHGDFLHSYAKQYDSLGDGTIQHSPVYQVQTEKFIDYLSSLYVYLQENLSRLEVLQFSWPDKFKFVNKELEILNSLRYKENKAQYFEKYTLKLSFSDSKKFDTRWEKIPSWADGSLEALFRFMLSTTYVDGTLEKYAIYIKAKAFLDEKTNWAAGDIEGSGINSTERKNDLEYAFLAVDHLVTSYYHIKRASRVFEALQHNYYNNPV